MSNLKERRGICPECKVRDNDSNRKILYECPYCRRWFCFKHLDSRLAVFRDFKTPIKETRLKRAIEEDWKREDGHPDYQFTLKTFEEVDLAEKNLSRLIKESLDRMNKYYGDEVVEGEPLAPIEAEKARQSRIELLLKEEAEIKEKMRTAKPKKAKKRIMKGVVSEGKFHFVKAEDYSKKRHFNIDVKGLAISLAFFIVGFVLFLYSSRNVYLIFIVPFIPFPIPFWIIGLGLMVIGGIGFIGSLY